MIYEINTWVWLDEVGRRLGAPVTLASVPDSEWDALAVPGAESVWLMGVWERSPIGRTIARTLPHLRAAYERALPGFADDDVVGSPYSVRSYTVDERLGGEAGLRAARAALDARGLGLILDFVPNHVACDHPWVERHPEFFVRGTGRDLEQLPGELLVTPAGVIAHGRDPNYPPWTDTLQLDAFHPGLRAAAADTLSRIADRCDGARCDMAMLPLNAVFERTWGARVGRPPRTEYWSEVIAEVRSRHPAFTLIAEAYWDLEWNLHQLGFDLCYDKRLYDRLRGGDAGGVQLHELAALPYQQRLLRFVENHDEARAAATFPAARGRAAAVVAATVPGVMLLHHGQLEGARGAAPGPARAPARRSGGRRAPRLLPYPAEGGVRPHLPRGGLAAARASGLAGQPQLSQAGGLVVAARGGPASGGGEPLRRLGPGSGAARLARSLRLPVAPQRRLLGRPLPTRRPRAARPRPVCGPAPLGVPRAEDVRVVSCQRSAVSLPHPATFHAGTLR